MAKMAARSDARSEEVSDGDGAHLELLPRNNGGDKQKYVHRYKLSCIYISIYEMASCGIYVCHIWQ